MKSYPFIRPLIAILMLASCFYTSTPGLCTAPPHIWSQRFGDEQGQSGAGLTVDNVGNIILTGDIHGSADFGGGELTSAGENDIFIASFDPDGNHNWSHIRMAIILGASIELRSFENHALSTLILI